VTEGAEWKRHRKVAAPAFTEKNYRMVWSETVRIMQDLLDVKWKRAKEIRVENVVDITVPVSWLCSFVLVVVLIGVLASARSRCTSSLRRASAIVSRGRMRRTFRPVTT
jgi:cytochrome P450